MSDVTYADEVVTNAYLREVDLTANIAPLLPLHSWRYLRYLSDWFLVGLA